MSCIKGVDLKLHDEVENYREVVNFIKNDANSLGALVTTHKIDLLKACRDMLEELDYYAQLTGEISCISKRDGKLRGHAKDPISSGLSLEAFLPENHWQNSHAEALVLGAGGSSIALTTYMLDPKHGLNRPARILVTDRNSERLHEIEHIHEQLASSTPVEYQLAAQPTDNDALVNQLPAASLVVNATGLGKDAPGSPLTGKRTVSSERLRLGIQLSRRPGLSRASSCTRTNTAAPRRRRLALFHPWLDESYRGGFQR